MRIFLWIFALMVANTLQAQNICFEFHQKTNTQSNILAKMKEEGEAFVSVNRTPVHFYTNFGSLQYGQKHHGGTSIEDKIIASTSRGCMDLGFLVVGRNDIELSFNFQGASVSDGWFEGSLYLVDDQQELVSICSSFVTSGRTEGNCSFSLHKTLEEINPELARQVQKMEEDLKRLNRFERVDELKGSFQSIYDILEKLKTLSFDELTENALSAFGKAVNLLSNLKKDVHTLIKEISDTQHKIQNELQSTQEMVRAELTRENISLTTLPSVNLSRYPAPTFPLPSFSTDSTDNFDSNNNIYKSYADKVLFALQSYLAKNNRTSFIDEVVNWTDTVTTYQDIALNREKFSKKEWQAYQQSYNRVHDYIYKQVDKDLWFKDSPVPTDVRNALRADLKTVAPDETSRLESVLKKFSKQNMTEEQKRAIEIVQALDLVAKGIVRVASDSADTIQEFRGVVKQTVEVISSGVKCLAQAQASGRVGSLYELFSGKDQCNGAELSASERVFSAVELALGTPKVFHVLGSAGSSILGGIIKGEKAAEAVKACKNVLDVAGEVAKTTPKHIASQIKDVQAWKQIADYLGNRPVTDINPFLGKKDVDRIFAKQNDSTWRSLRFGNHEMRKPVGKGMHYHLEEWTADGKLLKPDQSVNVLKTKDK